MTKMKRDSEGRPAAGQLKTSHGPAERVSGVPVGGWWSGKGWGGKARPGCASAHRFHTGGGVVRMLMICVNEGFMRVGWSLRCLAFLLVLGLPSGCSVPNTVTASTDSPAVVTDQFMRALFKSDRDLLRDEGFKRRYCSRGLRRAIDKALSDAASSPPPKEEPPAGIPGYDDRFNTTLFNAWDIPTSYKLGEAEQRGTSASVQVTYLWGPGTQYQGDTRITSVQLVAEEGAWRIDDLVTHKGAFVPEGSLRASLDTRKGNGP